MVVLGCVDGDCGDCTSTLLDVLACAALSQSEGSDLTVDLRRRWVRQREAEYSGGASGYRARRQATYSARGRAAGQVTHDGSSEA